MKVMIVDDDPFVIKSLKMIVTKEGMNFVGEACSGNEAFEKYKEYKPDVVLMDIRMKDGNGIDATREIMKLDPDAKIVLLTTFNDEEFIRDGMACGAKGYVLKQNIEDLVSILKTVNSGQMVIDSSLRDAITTVKPQHKIPDFLSEREKQILSLIATGKNNREISEMLFISEGTVKNYISSMLDKLELRDRTQLAVYYYQS